MKRRSSLTGTRYGAVTRHHPDVQRVGIVIGSRPGGDGDAIRLRQTMAGALWELPRLREIVDVFELTNRAAAALAERRAMNGLAESIAIRISTSESGNGSAPGYKLRFASHPAPDDLVLESSGTRVFLAPGLAEPLGGSVLDVVDTPQGPHLVLKHRPLAES